MFKTLYRVWWTPGRPEFYRDRELIGIYESKEDAEYAAHFGSNEYYGVYRVEGFRALWLWGLLRKVWFPQ